MNFINDNDKYKVSLTDYLERIKEICEDLNQFFIC